MKYSGTRSIKIATKSDCRNCRARWRVDKTHVPSLLASSSDCVLRCDEYHERPESIVLILYSISTPRNQKYIDSDGPYRMRYVFDGHTLSHSRLVQAHPFQSGYPDPEYLHVVEYG